MVKIHPVVNISRIHIYRGQVVGQKIAPPPSVVIEGKEKYEVEKILSKRKRYGKVEYLVYWKGLSSMDSLGPIRDNIDQLEPPYTYFLDWG